MKEIIYVYTTPTYKLKSWFKIGMTNQGSGSIRISQQDGTSNPERLEKQYEMDISGETELSAYEVEQKIHRFYERLGKRVRDNREWFEVEGGVEEIKRVIESILDNSDLHKSEIKLKPHQIEANTKINECFNSDDKRCLLAHKPRSGKTFTTIYNIKDNNYKNVVILTSYPILNFQWEEVILGFKGFSNTEVIIGSGINKIELNPLKNSIVLLSLQDVKGGEEVFEKDFNFVEIDLNIDDNITTKVEREFEKEIRTGKRLPWTNLSIEIDGEIINGDSAKESFSNAFIKILEKIDPVTVSLNFNRIFKENKEDYAEYKQNQCQKIGDFYLDCQSSTKEKMKQLKEVFKKYKINGDVDIK